MHTVIHLSERLSECVGWKYEVFNAYLPSLLSCKCTLDMIIGFILFFLSPV